MLTKRQKQILGYIEKFIKEKDYAPTIEEIKKHFRLSSLGTIHKHIENLKSKGYLRKIENHPRSIEINHENRLSDLIQIPLLGTISAGEPIEAIQEKEFIAVPKTRLPINKDIYALRVTGNSMIDENINDGDIVLIKHQSVAENGQKIVALINNDEATLKTFYKERGQIRLQPANNDYEPTLIRNGEAMIAIQGIVIDVIKNEGLPEKILEKFKSKEKIKRYNKLPLNRIICGDAVDVMKRMPDCSIDLTITSPPYDELRNYNGYHFDFEGIAKNLFRITKKGGVLVWVVGDQTIKGNETGTSFRQALYFKQAGFNLFDTMIYLKTPRGAVGNNKTYWQSFEYMFILSKGTPKTINLIKDRENKDERSGDNGTKRLNDGTLLKLKRAGYSKHGRRTNVWEYLIERGHSASDDIAYKHPAIFPEKLVQDHVASWSNPGDVVFDPMCGSGTTCKVARLNKRDFIGIDISPEYCKIAEDRSKQKPLF